MALEIERKYLVNGTLFRSMAHTVRHIRQGYLTRRPEGTVRIRLADGNAWITVKGKNQGDTRLEFEYEVPFADGEQMLSFCEGRILDKFRYIIDFEGFTWEVDEFHGDREGLIIAEVELPTSDIQPPLPPFIDREVTGNPAYYNSAL